MIAEFERRLADVLSARLPAPFTGQADTPPGTNGTRILVGVTQSVCIEPQFGSKRPERVPPSVDPRRVVKLRCTVAINTTPSSQSQDRRNRVSALDAALYTITAPEFLNGSVLLPEDADDDPGFIIQEMHPLETTSPLDLSVTNAAPLGMTLSADGWFWPVNATGEAGVEIAEVRVRSTAVPFTVSPARPILKSGGAALPITISLDNGSLMRLHAAGSPDLAALPFDTLAFKLVDAGERPGAGTLSGGTAGSAGARLIKLADGVYSVTYTPPASAVTDFLVVAMDNGENGAGEELGRTRIVVKA